MVRKHAVFALTLLLGIAARSQSAPLSIPPDSPRWELEGNAKVVDFLGRKSLFLDGGAAILKDFEMRDAVIDFDMASTGKRGFAGMDFRLDKDGKNGEELYLRPHESGYPDAIQYTPVLNTGRNWQLYNGPGFTASVDIPRNEWLHIRLVVTGAQAKLYVKDMDKPALDMTDLKSGMQQGQFALLNLLGGAYFSNIEIRPTPDAPWNRQQPTMPPGTLTAWHISPAYDAQQRDLEQPLTASDIAGIQWQQVEAEPPGLVVLYRYRDAPHPRVTFQNDFSTRLEPQPGMKVLYARTTIDSDREQRKKLEIGYSDDVTVFLNGQPLWRGRSAQAFRDPRFLGIVNPENDTVYLPLKKGKNELVLAISELGGGWGFICRLKDVKP